MQLKQQFQTLKNGGLSITDYLDKMKGITDALKAIAHLVFEYDLCNQILNGLGLEYDSIYVSIINRKALISFEELFGQLITFELRLEAHNFTPIHITVLYMSTSSGYSGVMVRLIIVLMVEAVTPTLGVAIV